jgi:hypothetical protein
MSEVPTSMRRKPPQIKTLWRKPVTVTVRGILGDGVDPGRHPLAAVVVPAVRHHLGLIADRRGRATRQPTRQEGIPTIPDPAAVVVVLGAGLTHDHVAMVEELTIELDHVALIIIHIVEDKDIGQGMAVYHP